MYTYIQVMGHQRGRLKEALNSGPRACYGRLGSGCLYVITRLQVKTARPQRCSCITSGRRHQLEWGRSVHNGGSPRHLMEAKTAYNRRCRNPDADQTWVVGISRTTNVLYGIKRMPSQGCDSLLTFFNIRRESPEHT